MQDNLSIIITMIIFVTLVVIFPLYNLFERQDDMSYTLALKATTSFVDEIRNNGYIDQNSYNDFVSQLGNTGNSYDIELEAHRKILIEDVKNPGEFLEQYKIDYNEDILSVINTGTTNISGKVLRDNAYLLNQDDQIYVKLKNSNTTMAGAVFNAIIPTAKKERIVVNYGGVIKNSSWDKVESTIHSFTTKPSAPVVSNVDGTPINGTITVYANTNITFTAKSTISNWWDKIDKFIWTFEYGNGATETNISTNATLNGDDYVASISKSFPSGAPSKITVYAASNDGQASDAATITVKIRPIFQSKTFSYTGTYQTFTVPSDGKYKLEVWGAQGGYYGVSGGKGGYSYGEITLNEGQLLYVFVGEMGKAYFSNPVYPAWNGGGMCTNWQNGASVGGGGATDIRTSIGSGTWYDSTGLNSRIIVAAGGGGANDNQVGGYGGGLTGGTNGGNTATGGTQTVGGINTNSNYGDSYGKFGAGGNLGSGWGTDIGFGGSGWYGGAAYDGGGSGGSGYIGTLLNANTIAGNTSFSSPYGGTEVGHSGDGSAKISIVE